MVFQSLSSQTVSAILHVQKADLKKDQKNSENFYLLIQSPKLRVSMMLLLRRIITCLYLLIQARQRKKDFCQRKMVCIYIISSGESSCFSLYGLAACQKSVYLLKKFPYLCIQHCITVWQTSGGKMICSNIPVLKPLIT